MKQGITQHHFRDTENKPAGGHTYGTGFAIAWQNGPLGQHAASCDPDQEVCTVECERKAPNGAFVEDVLEAVIGRIEEYENSRFACHDNADALLSLKAAARALDRRTQRRTAEGTEGTHKGA